MIHPQRAMMHCSGRCKVSILRPAVSTLLHEPRVHPFAGAADRVWSLAIISSSPRSRPLRARRFFSSFRPVLSYISSIFWCCSFLEGVCTSAEELGNRMHMFSLTANGWSEFQHKREHRRSVVLAFPNTLSLELENRDGSRGRYCTGQYLHCPPL